MFSKKKHKCRKGRNLLHALEPVLKGTKEALVHDLGVDVTYPGDIRSREPKHPDYVGCDPYLFKRFRQVLDFDKRIIWSCDKSYSDLSKEALKAFKGDQNNYLLPEPVSQRGNLVLQLAKEICTNILGTFSYDTWFDSCSFGRRAAVGLPLSKSYLDERFKRLSGTDLQWAAFNHALSRDTHLLRAVRKGSRTRKVLDEIKAVTVPKSFKAARIIAPDTILGGFLSRGLGDYIRSRLEKETHIDLSKQQDRHSRWARDGSLYGHLATLDMSKASDSFTWRHIECLVPEDWHHALDVVRTRRCNVDGEVIEPKSYMLMGSGHTFPLQTLLFYCLAEATRRLLKKTGKVSVYGDDIIVPVKTSIPLIEVFMELGFVINSEKSFYDPPDALRPNHTFFRESCGADFKGGVDVRPYMPECDLMGEGVVPRNEIIAWCHKIINGLLDHWDSCELPFTLGFLLSTIESMKKAVCFVPSWEVDHAGIRHYLPPYHLIGRKVSYVTYENSHPTYFKLVFQQPRRKRGVNERPYLWYSYFLQRNLAVDSGDPIVTDMSDGSVTAARELYSSSVQLDGESRKDIEGVFRWKKAEQKRLR